MRVEHGITVARLLSEPRLAPILSLVAGRDGTERAIDHPRVQKPGLALVGHTHGVVPSRVQILGETEITYLETLPEDEQSERARVLFDLGLSLVVVTRGVQPPPALAKPRRPLLSPGEASPPASDRDPPAAPVAALVDR